jgi:hypothetical protein
MLKARLVQQVCILAVKRQRAPASTLEDPTSTPPTPHKAVRPMDS